MSLIDICGQLVLSLILTGIEPDALAQPETGRRLERF
jgi:hypothetical protein